MPLTTSVEGTVDCPCGGLVMVNGRGLGVCRSCGTETWPDERGARTVTPGLEYSPRAVAFATENLSLGPPRSSSAFNRARHGMKL